MLILSQSVCLASFTLTLATGIGHSDYAQSRLKEFCTIPPFCVYKTRNTGLTTFVFITVDIGEVETPKRHDNMGDGLPWYYQTQVLQASDAICFSFFRFALCRPSCSSHRVQLGLDTHREHHPRPFHFAVPDDAEPEEDILQGPRLGADNNTQQDVTQKV